MPIYCENFYKKYKKKPAVKSVKGGNKIEPVKEKTKIHHEQSKDTFAVGDATFMKKDDDFAINISKRKDIDQNVFLI